MKISFINLRLIQGLIQKQNFFVVLSMIFCFAFSAFTEQCYGQTDLQAWANITGMRLQGELMGFESGLRVVGNLNLAMIHRNCLF